ncbi:unnamed protein product, partial [Timema podura]|nr:unnamed protein product [Timema podura]
QRPTSQSSSQRPTSQSSSQRPIAQPNRSQPSSLQKPTLSSQKAREFPPNDLKNRPLSSKNVAPHQFPPPDLRPKQFPPPDVRRKQFPPADVRRKPKPSAKLQYYECLHRSDLVSGRIESDDEYDSELDDFIDDGPEETEDYSKHIREIFGYDKSKYNDMDEDDECMESNFGQVLKEEFNSAKIG